MAVFCARLPISFRWVAPSSLLAAEFAFYEGVAAVAKVEDQVGFQVIDDKEFVERAHVVVEGVHGEVIFLRRHPGGPTALRRRLFQDISFQIKVFRSERYVSFPGSPIDRYFCGESIGVFVVNQSREKYRVHIINVILRK